MKIIGIALLIVGFLWIVFDASFHFTAFAYARWMWQSKQLPAGETVQRSEAVSGLRDMSLALKDRHRFILLPAALMFAGGMIVSFAPKMQRAKTDLA